MLSRDITLPIQSFHLKFGKEYDINDINQFINAAIQRGIEKLDIDMLENVKGLTDNILSCKTLTVLKLKNLFVKDDNWQVNLPLLKVLCIDNMRFSHAYIKYYQVYLNMSHSKGNPNKAWSILFEEV